MPRTLEALAAGGPRSGATAPLRVISSRYGSIDVPGESVLEFPEGLVGFVGLRRLALLEPRPGSPFRWLLSLDDPEIGFAVADPTRLVPAYAPPLEEAASALGAPPVDVDLLALVTIPSDPRRMTANLAAPIAIDRRRRIGRQIVLADPRHDPAHPILRRSR